MNSQPLRLASLGDARIVQILGATIVRADRIGEPT
jgi:hypothetical protein